MTPPHHQHTQTSRSQLTLSGRLCNHHSSIITPRTRSPSITFHTPCPPAPRSPGSLHDLFRQLLLRWRSHCCRYLLRPNWCRLVSSERCSPGHHARPWRGRSGSRSGWRWGQARDGFGGLRDLAGAPVGLERGVANARHGVMG